jgi:glycosidase
VVFGHSDNQGLRGLNHHFFAGPNMYGQNLNYRNPVVRAILLEMQRRKVNFGADGVRVDGAQDFKWWDADSEMMRHRR